MQEDHCSYLIVIVSSSFRLGEIMDFDQNSLSFADDIEAEQSRASSTTDGYDNEKELCSVIDKKLQRKQQNAEYQRRKRLHDKKHLSVFEQQQKKERYDTTREKYNARIALRTFLDNIVTENGLLSMVMREMSKKALDEMIPLTDAANMKFYVDAYKKAAEFELQEVIDENTAKMEMDTTETNEHDFIYNMKYRDYLFRHMTKGGVLILAI